MTGMALIRDLTAHLAEITKEYNAARNDKGEIASPKVFEWSLPYKLAKNRNPKQNPRSRDADQPESEEDDIDDDLFPYIVVRLKKGVDTEDDSSILVELIFAVKDESPEVNGLIQPTGFSSLLTFIEYVRIKLQQHPVVGGKFKLEKPFEWEIDHAQPYPYFEGIVKTKWTVPSIIDERSAKLIYE